MGLEVDADVEAEGRAEIFGGVEGVEGDFVEEEVCVVVPDGDVLVYGGVVFAPEFELLAIAFEGEIYRGVGEFYTDQDLSPKERCAGEGGTGGYF